MTKSAYTPLKGGIDMVTPPTLVDPGACLYAVNYECPITGGYKRIEGYAAVGPEVPGEGPLLGVASIDEQKLAVRKDVGADAATLYQYNAVTDAWDTVAAVNNGRHEFVEGNLYATTGGRALYGVGGGQPFELNKDGTFTLLSNAPSGALYIHIFKEHLFLGLPQGSLQHSGPGAPNEWDAATEGAGEIGVGQKLNGLVLGRGGVLHVMCDDSVQTLYGSSAEDWQLKITVPNSGARPYSAQSLMMPYFVAERGIGSLSATEQFGDFLPMQPGQPIEPLFIETARFASVVASGVSKRKAQYRMFFDNGTGIYLSPAGITTVRFPHQVAVAHSGETDAGDEMLLFGSDAGIVYRLDNLAESFAGEEIEAFLALAYNHLNSTSVRKRFRRVFWDVRAGSEANVSFLADYNHGRSDTGIPLREFIQFLQGGGLWNVDDWDSFGWSVPSLGQEPMSLGGTASSINFSIYSKSIGLPHEILGYDIHYEQRRRRRG